MALRNGVQVLYHIDLADEETLDLMEAAKDSIIVGPTLAIYHNMMNEGLSYGFFDKAKIAPAMERNAWVAQQVRRRGIKTIIGGDYGLAWQKHGTNARDIEHLVNYGGYSNIEALQCATRVGAELMGYGGELGQIKPAFLADLLLVRGDPTKDVRILPDADNLLAIMKDGKFHKAPMSSASQTIRVAA